MPRDIYFLNSSELAEKLSDKSVSDYLALRHFIIFLIIFNSAYVFPILTVPAQQYEWLSLVATFISMAAINYYGLIWLFQINNKGDGAEFFKRFCCLSLPVSIKATLVVLVAFVVATLIISGILRGKDSGSAVVDIVMYLLEVGYLLYFYKLMGQSFRASSNYT
ncbi:hypothetical protein ACFL3A_05495 [Pseudomonadota bacterium]